jgi:hypothetical protein
MLIWQISSRELVAIVVESILTTYQITYHQPLLNSKNYMIRTGSPILLSYILKVYFLSVEQGNNFSNFISLLLA